MRELTLTVLTVFILVGAGCNYKLVKVEDERDLKIRELQEEVENLKYASSTGEIAGKNLLDQQNNNKNNNTKLMQKTIEKTGAANQNLEISQKKLTETQTSETEGEFKISSVQAIPTTNDINFRWQTNKDSTGFVTLWPVSTESGNIIFHSSILRKIHSINANSLKLIPGKTYSFNITAKSNDSDTTFSEEKTVTLPSDLVPPEITISPNKMGGTAEMSALFNIKTNEPATVKFEYYTNIDSNKKSVYYNFNNENYYLIPVDLAKTGYSDKTDIFLRVIAYDAFNNYSETGWLKYGVDKNNRIYLK